jgi:formate dehydrogenase major subunit
MRFLWRLCPSLPNRTLMEKAVIDHGQPEHSTITTCAYCGVGCSFKAEMKGEQLVRMVPDKNGQANHGHSCVKGRFAFGYATHKDRITTPMIREKISDAWREVSWEEAIQFAADRSETNSDQIRQILNWRHHIVTLYQRRNLS